MTTKRRDAGGDPEPRDLVRQWMGKRGFTYESLSVALREAGFQISPGALRNNIRGYKSESGEIGHELARWLAHLGGSELTLDSLRPLKRT